MKSVAVGKEQNNTTTIAKELSTLADGQTVRIQPVKHQGHWGKATVIKKVSARSYLVSSIHPLPSKTPEKKFNTINKINHKI